jgi:hypothetical protein
VIFFWLKAITTNIQWGAHIECDFWGNDIYDEYIQVEEILVQIVKCNGPPQPVVANIPPPYDEAAKNPKDQFASSDPSDFDVT